MTKIPVSLIISFYYITFITHLIDEITEFEIMQKILYGEREYKRNKTFNDTKIIKQINI